MPYDSDDELGQLVSEDVEIPDDFLPPLQDAPPEDTNICHPDSFKNSDITDIDTTLSSQKQTTAAALSNKTDSAVLSNKNKRRLKTSKTWEKKSFYVPEESKLFLGKTDFLPDVTSLDSCYSFLKYFFDDDLIQLICYQSSLYNAVKSPDQPCNLEKVELER